MRELNDFIIKNNINRKRNLVVMFIITLISCLSIYVIKLSGMSVYKKDYFFVTWFIVNIYYIYLAADIASFDFEGKIIDFSYSAGISRTAYLLRKILLLVAVGILHGAIIFIGYKFIFLNVVIKSSSQYGLEIILIYLLVFLLIGSIDILLALLNCTKSKIIMSNFIILVVLPTLVQAAISALNSSVLMRAFQVSPLALILSIPMEINIRLITAIVTLITIAIINILSFSINKSRDF